MSRASSLVATHFAAMGSPCVVLADTHDAALGKHIGSIARNETLRLEAKFSRYRPSVVAGINQTAGQRIEVDEETANLLDYAALCFELSDGRFDITSGVLRRAWKFDGSDRVPDPELVRGILGNVGWSRVDWSRPYLRLERGMEIDFGGIGKEYAVDRALTLVAAQDDAPFLVNLGGDLRVSAPRQDGSAWLVAIEDVDATGASAGMLELPTGALATSGDAHRFLLKDGHRYGHVLDPLTGWPILDAPRSVTVHAGTCSEAGLLAKLAILKGAGAEAFLAEERVQAWIER
jgi:thiamine biosynthesis lipoprotein